MARSLKGKAKYTLRERERAVGLESRSSRRYWLSFPIYIWVREKAGFPENYPFSFLSSSGLVPFPYAIFPADSPVLCSPPFMVRNLDPIEYASQFCLLIWLLFCRYLVKEFPLHHFLPSCLIGWIPQGDCKAVFSYLIRFYQMSDSICSLVFC